MSYAGFFLNFIIEDDRKYRAFITVHTGDGVFCLGNAYHK